MTWLISPPEATSWSMRRSDVDSLLRNLWPNVEIVDSTPDSKMAMFWEVTENSNDWATGSLEDIGQCIYVKGSTKKIAQLAFHAKRELASSQDLILYDDSYSMIISLDEKTEEEILEDLNEGS